MTHNQGHSYRLELGPAAAGHTVLSFLVMHYPHSNGNEWQARLHAGEILLNDQWAHGMESLRAGNTLVWNRPGWEEPETPQTYEVIYADESLLVVNKPSGLPTMPGGGFHWNTLFHLVRQDFPAANPVHRLGRSTSGLVVFALTSAAAAELTRQWSQFHKQYRALASGVAQEESYDIQTPIGKVPHPKMGTVYAACSSGKRARSVARVLERRTDATLFEVDLHTGRPHQIRIHLAAIGQPLVGDPLYASGGVPQADDPGVPGDGGYWLHAGRLSCCHPVSGLPLELNAVPPAILQVHRKLDS